MNEGLRVSLGCVTAVLLGAVPVLASSATAPSNAWSLAEQHKATWYSRPSLFIGLLGLPLLPDTTVRADVPAAFLSYHAQSDPQLEEKLGTMLKQTVPVLMTDTLARELGRPNPPSDGSVAILEVPRDCWKLMDLPADRLAAVRGRMLEPFGIELAAPTRVGLYLFGENVIIVENFSEARAPVRLTVDFGRATSLLTIHSARITSSNPPEVTLDMPAHSPIAIGLTR